MLHLDGNADVYIYLAVWQEIPKLDIVNAINRQRTGAWGNSLGYQFTYFLH
jgi:hypothetical protein